MYLSQRHLSPNVGCVWFRLISSKNNTHIMENMHKKRNREIELNFHQLDIKHQRYFYHLELFWSWRCQLVYSMCKHLPGVYLLRKWRSPWIEVCWLECPFACNKFTLISHFTPTKDQNAPKCCEFKIKIHKHTHRGTKIMTMRTVQQHKERWSYAACSHTWDMQVSSKKQFKTLGH